MTQSAAPPVFDAASAPAPLAVYANIFEVGHNAFEVLFSFGQYRPERTAVQVHTLIMAGPVQAKLFARLLADAGTRFEEEHGAIADMGESPLEALMAAAPDFGRRALQARMSRSGADAGEETPTPRTSDRPDQR